MKIRRLFVSLAIATSLVSCGGASSDQPTVDPTATRAAELTQVANIQASKAAEASTEAASTPIEDATLSTPIPSPIPSPTPTPAATPTPTPMPTPTEESESNLLDQLPVLDDLPNGFAVTSEKPDSAADIAASYPDPNAHLDRLQQWGFKQAAERYFEIPSPGLNDSMSKMILYYSAVSEFGSPEQARQAIEFNIQFFKNMDGSKIQSVSVENIGDKSYAAQGTISDQGSSAIVAFLWVQKGRLAFYFRGASLGYNSMDDVVSITKKAIAR